MQRSFIDINKKLFVYIGKSRYLLYIIFTMVVISSVLGALKPVFIGEIIDLLTISYTIKSLDESLLIELILFFVLSSTAAALIQYIQAYFSSHFIKELLYNLRSDVFEKISSMPISYFDTHSHGDTMSRLVNDTENVAQVLSQTIASFLLNFVSIVSITAFMLYYSPLLTLLVFVCMPSSVFLIKILSRKMRSYFKEKHKYYGELEGFVEENIYAYETLLAYNKRESVHDKFKEINNKFKTYSTKASILTCIVNPLLNVLSGFTYIVVLFVGAYMLMQGRISLGVIQLFLMYVRMLNYPLNNITSLYAQIQTAYAGADRLFDLLDQSHETIFQEEYKKNSSIEGEIEFIHMNFGYMLEKKNEQSNKENKKDFDKAKYIAPPNKNAKKKVQEEKEYQLVLEDFNLKIHKGEKIALVGETGSGKTSIINAFMRFYPYQSGQIKLDGKNIEDYDLTLYRKAISLVAQEPFLMSDSIKANIAYPSSVIEISNEEEQRIKIASLNANAEDFINKLPEKYDTILSGEGKNLSLGQKQLLCLARTFMQDSPILIMDEATANVDTLTEMQIQEAIFKLMRNKTCIVIAHRLSTIIKMDKIIVIAKGKIAEMGTHAELLEKKAAYYDLYTQQLQYVE